MDIEEEEEGGRVCKWIERSIRCASREPLEVGLRSSRGRLLVPSIVYATNDTARSKTQLLKMMWLNQDDLLNVVRRYHRLPL